MKGMRGNGSLVMVMLLMMIGLLLMAGMQRQQDAALLQGHDERLYWQALNQAESSLNWGLGQRWPMDDPAGTCLDAVPGALRVCLMPMPGETYRLLRAQGRASAQAEVVLYRRVVPDTPEQAMSRVQPLAGGWLDFCPENGVARCAGG